MLVGGNLIRMYDVTDNKRPGTLMFSGIFANYLHVMWFSDERTENISIVSASCGAYRISCSEFLLTNYTPFIDCSFHFIRSNKHLLNFKSTFIGSAKGVKQLVTVLFCLSVGYAVIYLFFSNNLLNLHIVFWIFFTYAISSLDLSL